MSHSDTTDETHRSTRAHLVHDKASFDSHTHVGATSINALAAAAPEGEERKKRRADPACTMGNNDKAKADLTGVFYVRVEQIPFEEDFAPYFSGGGGVASGIGSASTVWGSSGVSLGADVTPKKFRDLHTIPALSVDTFFRSPTTSSLPSTGVSAAAARPASRSQQKTSAVFAKVEQLRTVSFAKVHEVSSRNKTPVVKLEGKSAPTSSCPLGSRGASAAAVSVGSALFASPRSRGKGLFLESSTPLHYRSQPDSGTSHCGGEEGDDTMPFSPQPKRLLSSTKVVVKKEVGEEEETHLVHAASCHSPSRSLFSRGGGDPKGPTKASKTNTRGDSKRGGTINVRHSASEPQTQLKGPAKKRTFASRLDREEERRCSAPATVSCDPFAESYAAADSADTFELSVLTSQREGGVVGNHAAGCEGLDAEWEIVEKKSNLEKKQSSKLAVKSSSHSKIIKIEANDEAAGEDVNVVEKEEEEADDVSEIQTEALLSEKEKLAILEGLRRVSPVDPMITGSSPSLSPTRASDPTSFHSPLEPWNPNAGVIGVSAHETATKTVVRQHSGSVRVCRSLGLANEDSPSRVEPLLPLYKGVGNREAIDRDLGSRGARKERATVIPTVPNALEPTSRPFYVIPPSVSAVVLSGKERLPTVPCPLSPHGMADLDVARALEEEHREKESKRVAKAETRRVKGQWGAVTKGIEKESNVGEKNEADTSLATMQTNISDVSLITFPSPSPHGLSNSLDKATLHSTPYRDRVSSLSHPLCFAADMLSPPPTACAVFNSPSASALKTIRTIADPYLRASLRRVNIAAASEDFFAHRDHTSNNDARHEDSLLFHPQPLEGCVVSYYYEGDIAGKRAAQNRREEETLMRVAELEGELRALRLESVVKVSSQLTLSRTTSAADKGSIGVCGDIWAAQRCKEDIGGRGRRRRARAHGDIDETLVDLDNNKNTQSASDANKVRIEAGERLIDELLVRAAEEMTELSDFEEQCLRVAFNVAGTTMYYGGLYLNAANESDEDFKTEEQTLTEASTSVEIHVHASSSSINTVVVSEDSARRIRQFMGEWAAALTRSIARKSVLRAAAASDSHSSGLEQMFEETLEACLMLHRSLGAEEGCATAAELFPSEYADDAGSEDKERACRAIGLPPTVFELRLINSWQRFIWGLATAAVVSKPDTATSPHFVLLFPSHSSSLSTPTPPPPVIVTLDSFQRCLDLGVSPLSLIGSSALATPAISNRTLAVRSDPDMWRGNCVDVCGLVGLLVSELSNLLANKCDEAALRCAGDASLPANPQGAHLTSDDLAQHRPHLASSRSSNPLRIVVKREPTADDDRQNVSRSQQREVRPNIKRERSASGTATAAAALAPLPSLLSPPTKLKRSPSSLSIDSSDSNIVPNNDVFVSLHSSTHNRRRADEKLRSPTPMMPWDAQTEARDRRITFARSASPSSF